jgi:PHP family Zn ribbon phosphoesterase
MEIGQIYSKKIWDVYNRLMKEFGSELNVLLKTPEHHLSKVANERVTKAIMSVRKGRISIQPGYDGVYGKPLFGGEEENKRDEPETNKVINRQRSISDFG